MTTIISVVAPDGTWAITDSATSNALTDRQVAQRFGITLAGSTAGFNRSTSSYFKDIIKIWLRRLDQMPTDSYANMPAAAGTPANIISVTYKSIAYVIVDTTPLAPLQSTHIKDRFELTEGGVHKAYARSFAHIMRKWLYRIDSVHGGI